MANINKGYTSARSYNATLGNFSKATFDAISESYNYFTPDLSKETVFTKSPYQEFTGHLVKTQLPAMATTQFLYTKNKVN
ncbi:40S ribosomal protein S2 [Pteropus alecto]|uniref:40S ribosomal protein S2 n=1 Tax=Pteropus alecto TaxID=9402 RepID=L5KIF0_PTEAL|nr:40S ribosomal protein S2 [Pteropus alecto]